MGKINLIVLCLALFLFSRALSYVIFYLDLYRWRDKECIERIVKQQKAVDMMNGSYHLFVSIVNALFVLNGFLFLFKVACLPVVALVSLLVITVAYTLFILFKARMQVKYKLHNFYVDMICYRSEQEVVTADNDFEVSFIRGYQRNMKHKHFMNLWYIISFVLLIFVYWGKIGMYI